MRLLVLQSFALKIFSVERFGIAVTVLIVFSNMQRKITMNFSMGRKQSSNLRMDLGFVRLKRFMRNILMFVKMVEIFTARTKAK